MTQLTPYEEDPVVHDLLANLAQFAPDAGFSDRVMTHVWRPAPSWIQRVTHACSTAFDRRRVWTIVGGLASTSAVAMVALIVTAVAYRVHIETTWSVMTSVAVDLWRFGVQLTAGLVVFGMRWIEPSAFNYSTLMALALSTTVVLGLSGLGLQHTIRQYRNQRISLHAGR